MTTSDDQDLLSVPVNPYLDVNFSPQQSTEPGPQTTVDPVTATDSAPEQRFQQNLDRILNSFSERSATYEQTIRTLHSEASDLRQDQVRAILKPIFEGLASLHTEATKAQGAARDRDPVSADDFAFFARSIEELFSLYDIDSVGARVGAPANSGRHHISQVKKTDDPSLDGTVARVQRQGFSVAGSERTLLPAQVTVYRYRGPDHDADTGTTPEAGI